MLRVILVSRVTARSLQNNIVWYVPRSRERSRSKFVKPLSGVVISSLTLTYTTPDSGLTCHISSSDDSEFSSSDVMCWDFRAVLRLGW